MKIAQPHGQITLLDVAPDIVSKGCAQSRNIFGNFAEDFVCAALGLHPISINGKYDVCPDAKLLDIYWEVKSLRFNNKMPLYDHRMAKEATIPNLKYGILLHDFRNLLSVRELLDKCLAQPPALVAISASKIHEMAKEQKLRKPKPREGADKRIGYLREGYRDGYRNLSAKTIRENVTVTAKLNLNLYQEALTCYLYT